MKLLLYGNTLVDNVYMIHDFPTEGKSNNSFLNYKSVGGTGNIVRVAKKYFPHIDITVQTAIGNDEDGDYICDFLRQNTKNSHIQSMIWNTSSALIMSDTQRGTKTSVVNWGACTQLSIDPLIQEDTDWVHFMYLDKLENLTRKQILNLTCTKSVDICSGTIQDSDRVEFIMKLSLMDYIFISADEAKSFLPNKSLDDIAFMLGAIANKYVIIHHDHGSIYSNGKEIHYINREPLDLKFINALGAGDCFATAFISTVGVGNRDMRSAIIYSHEMTERFLKETTYD